MNFKISKPKIAINMRNVLKKTHLYIGLTLGLLISLVSFSGSIVVYKPELEKFFRPKLAFVEPKDNCISLDTLLNVVKEAYPENRVKNIVLYGGKNVAYSFRTSRKNDNVRGQVYVDQYTGELLGIDYYDNNFLQWVYDFHTNLLAGKKGRVFNATMGFCFIILLLTGVLIAVPKSRKFKNIFRFYKGRLMFKKIFDLHRISGLLVFIFLLVIAFTGSYYGFKDTYHYFFEAITATKAKANIPKVKIEKFPYIGPQKVFDIATQAFPEGKPTLLFLPNKKRMIYSVRMQKRTDFGRTGNNHIYISPYSGKVLGKNIWKDKPLAEKLTRSMYFIHFGTFGGHFTRILWVIIGLLVPFLYFTGFIIWWKKRR